MDLERRKITHYFVRPVEPDVWVPLYFITRDGDGVIYAGYDRHPYLDPNNNFKPLKDIEQFGNALAKLLNPLEVLVNSQNHGLLWLTQDSEIYFSTKDDPVRDPNSRFLQK